MSQLARASSETEGPAVSDMAPENPKTHGRAASTWERIAATACLEGLERGDVHAVCRPSATGPEHRGERCRDGEGGDSHAPHSASSSRAFGN